MRAIKAKVNSPDGRGMSCFACSMMVDGLQTMIKENKTDDEIAAWLVGLCDFFNVEQPHVCKNIIYAFKVDLLSFGLKRIVLICRMKLCSFLKILRSLRMKSAVRSSKIADIASLQGLSCGIWQVCFSSDSKWGRFSILKFFNFLIKFYLILIDPHLLSSKYIGWK